MASDSPQPRDYAVMKAPDPVESQGERKEPPLERGTFNLFSGEAPSAPALRREPARQAEDMAVEPQDRSPPEAPGGAGNGPRSPAPAAGGPPSGEPRRTLHLSLSGGDGGYRHDRELRAAQSPPVRGTGERPMPLPGIAGPAIDRATGSLPPTGNGAPMRALPEAAAGREAGAFIDRALRERVGDDVAVFLAAFDAALDQDSAESRTGLREATDRLLRAGARTRIELERLEARVPLVPRERGGQEARGFRPR